MGHSYPWADSLGIIYFQKIKIFLGVKPMGLSAPRNIFYFLKGNNTKRVIPRVTMAHWFNPSQYFSVSVISVTCYFAAFVLGYEVPIMLS